MRITFKFIGEKVIAKNPTTKTAKEKIIEFFIFLAKGNLVFNYFLFNFS